MSKKRTESKSEVRRREFLTQSAAGAAMILGTPALAGSAGAAPSSAPGKPQTPDELRAYLAPLRGATCLACSCKADELCHADVLIEYLEKD